jgi:hypothetical protein
MKVMKEMNNYFEKEYQETKALLENKPNWVTSEKEVVNNAIQRCLGVLMFAQQLGVTYQETLVYEYYQEKLNGLLKK